MKTNSKWVLSAVWRSYVYFSILCPSLLSDYFILFLYPPDPNIVLPFKDMSIAFLPFLLYQVSLSVEPFHSVYEQGSYLPLNSTYHSFPPSIKGKNLKCGLPCYHQFFLSSFLYRSLFHWNCFGVFNNFMLLNSTSLSQSSFAWAMAASTQFSLKHIHPSSFRISQSSLSIILAGPFQSLLLIPHSQTLSCWSDPRN